MSCSGRNSSFACRKSGRQKIISDQAVPARNLHYKNLLPLCGPFLMVSFYETADERRVNQKKPLFFTKNFKTGTIFIKYEPKLCQ
ncbi:MAG: hypothetical protein DRI57_12465 [Deltaproteobacteria bacterium]|nr:MAG: hypothetical protein DRI57_12465 [Deltaproteobacteria bacterium]